MKRQNLHIYPSPFRFETRILKETKSLINKKLVDNIMIASVWEANLLEFEKIDDKRSIKRFKLLTHSFKRSRFIEALKYIEFVLKTFFHYRKEKIEYVNCHSLLVLIIGVMLKKFGNSKIIIYDAHELETERVGLTGGAQKFTKFLEKRLMPYVDKTIVVCEPIADWYRKEYGMNEVYVVQNIPNRHTPPLHKPTFLKDSFNIPYDHILFIYQGLLMKGRGIDALLDVFISAPKDKHIVFMGYGESEEKIKQTSANYSNIHFQPAVKSDDIIKYTASADVGIFFISGQICLSYQYSLPNKFGEYLMAGLPVLVSESLSYMTNILKQQRCGWSLNSDNNEDLSRFILKLDQEMLNKIKGNVKKYSSTLGWEIEEAQFQYIYNV